MSESAEPQRPADAENTDQWATFVRKLEEKLDSYYTQLSLDVTVELEEDPVGRGLENLNVKIAEGRRKANRVSNVIAELLRMREKFTQRAKTAKTAATLDYNHHRASMGKEEASDASARDALAKQRNARAVLVQERWEEVVNKVVACLTVAQHRYENLNLTLRNITDQQTTIRMQISIGELGTGTAGRRPTVDMPPDTTHQEVVL